MNSENGAMEELFIRKKTQDIGGQQSNISQIEFEVRRNEFHACNGPTSSNQNEREDVQQSNIKRLGGLEENERKRKKMTTPDKAEGVSVAGLSSEAVYSECFSEEEWSLEDLWSPDEMLELVSAAENADIPRLIEGVSKEWLEEYWKAETYSKKVKVLIKAIGIKRNLPIDLEEFLQAHFDKLIDAAENADIPKLIRKVPERLLKEYWDKPSSEKVKVFIEARDITTQTPTVLENFLNAHFDELFHTAEDVDIPRLIRKAPEEWLKEYWKSGASSEKVKLFIEARNITTKMPTVLENFLKAHFDELFHTADCDDIPRLIRVAPKKWLDQYWKSGASSEKVKVLIKAKEAVANVSACLANFWEAHFAELVYAADREDIPRLIRVASKEWLDQYWKSGATSEKVKTLIEARETLKQIPIGLARFWQTHFTELVYAADCDDIPKLIRAASKEWLDWYWKSGASSEKVKVLIKAKEAAPKVPTGLARFWQAHFTELVYAADRDDIPKLIRVASKEWLDRYWGFGASSKKVKVLIEARDAMEWVPTGLARFWRDHFYELVYAADRDDRPRVIKRTHKKHLKADRGSGASLEKVNAMDATTKLPNDLENF